MYSTVRYYDGARFVERNFNNVRSALLLRDLLTAADCPSVEVTVRTGILTAAIGQS